MKIEDDTSAAGVGRLNISCVLWVIISLPFIYLVMS